MKQTLNVTQYINRHVTTQAREGIETGSGSNHCYQSYVTTQAREGIETLTLSANVAISIVTTQAREGIETPRKDKHTYHGFW